MRQRRINATPILHLLSREAMMKVHGAGRSVSWLPRIVPAGENAGTTYFLRLPTRMGSGALLRSPVANYAGLTDFVAVTVAGQQRLFTAFPDAPLCPRLAD